MGITKMKRYYITLEKEIFARNDNDAKVKAAKFAAENDCITTELVSNPFGSLESRVVHKGTLTIYENKIIEND